MLTSLRVASSILLGALVFATFPVFAESVRYVSVFMLSSSDNADLSGGEYTYGHSFDGEARFGRSLGGALSLGWEMPDGLRFESEFGMYDTDTEMFEGMFYFTPDRSYPMPFRAVPMPMALDTMTLMGNVYYMHGGGWFKPYVGAGAGLARHRINTHLRGGPFGTFARANDSDIAFAWQAMVGAAADLSPRTELRLGYRWLRTQARFDSMFDDADQIGTGPLGVDLAKNIVQIGLSVKF